MVDMLARLRNWFVARRDIASLGALMLERQILAFPVLVVLLACVSFFFGGHCAAWQWWSAVAIVLILPWFTRDSRVALVADGAFVLLLIILWCVAPMVYDATLNTDYPRYHLPQIRLLIYGWNPISDPTADTISQTLGLRYEDMSYMHVAFVAKTAAIFSAVAYHFTGDATALTYPLVLFLFVGVGISMLRLVRSINPTCGWCSLLFAGMVYFWHRVPSHLYVDATLMLSAAGLLLTMWHSIRVQQIGWLRLSVFTFWMMNIKLPGCAAAFVFWLVFAGIVLWRERNFFWRYMSRFAITGCVLVVLMCIASYSPYITSWRDYGHPLYPFKTADQDKYPQHNLTGDFKVGNADYKQMGYWGEFFNAYLSPRLVRSYYNLKLNRDDFAPHKYAWDGSYEDTDVRAPLSVKERFVLWIVFAVLLMFSETRFLAVMYAISFFVVPREFFGFTRYQPWFTVFNVVAFIKVVSFMLDRLSRHTLCIMLAQVCLLIFVARALVGGIYTKGLAIVTKHEWLSESFDKAYVCFVPPKSPLQPNPDMEGKPLYRSGSPHLNNVRLLFRLIGRSWIDIDTLPRGMTAGYHETFLGYFLPGEENPIRKFTMKDKIVQQFKSWLQIYPESLFRRF